MTELIRNYIGGKWQESESQAVFRSENPASEGLIGMAVESSEQDVAAAVAAAQAAFDDWRAWPAPRRGELLYEVARILEERKEELSCLMTREMGKVIVEARGDVQEAIDMAYFMGGEGRRLNGYTAPVEMPNKFGMALRDPAGVVALITPWNFPCAVPSWKMLPALVAGNAIVWKPGEDVPAFSAAFTQVFADAGLPAGVLNLILGAGETGAALVRQPGVRVVSFTGSTNTGLQVYQTAAALGKKVSLEMGGKNAIIVMDDADFNLALEAVTWSAYGTSGQRCTACSRLLVQKGIATRFTEALVEKANTLQLGDGLCEDVQIGPLVNGQALEKVSAYMEVARAEGVAIAIGGQPAKMQRGHFFEPTVFTRVRREMRVAQEEIFGPVLAVIEIEDLDEAIDINNESIYGLSSSIFTADVNAAFRAMRDLTTGIVYINHGTTGAEIQFPFGGTRGTGNGMREAGLTALDAFTEWKSVYVDYSGTLQRAQIDNR